MFFDAKSQTWWPLRFVCTCLDLNACSFQPSSGLCRCHMLLLVFEISTFFSLLHIKLKSYFLYQVKTCHFQLDQRKVCRNVFRKRKKNPWRLFWKYLQVLTKIKTDIKKVHEQAICGKFDNSSKLGKPEQFQYLKKTKRIWQHDRLPWTSTQWCKSDKRKVIST